MLDFSGRTVLSEDGRIHMPNPSLNGVYADSVFRRALSQLVNYYEKVQIKFDRELSSEVLADELSNHWMYTKDGVHWPEAITSCYTFV